MKILGLGSVVKHGSTPYTVTKIAKDGITLAGPGKPLIFSLPIFTNLWLAGEFNVDVP